jgi:hypothetical protein
MNRRHLISGLVGSVSGIVFLFSLVFIVSAFTGPSGNPPSGGQGAISSDSRNISLGTSTVLGGTKLFIAASSSLSDYALRVMQPGGAGIFSVQNNGYVGVSIWPALATLHVGGSMIVANSTTFSNVAYTWPSVVGTNNQVLTTGGGNPATLSWTTVSSGGGGGVTTTTPSTANYVAKFSATSTITNSIIRDDGTNVGINYAPGSYRLRVSGDIKLVDGASRLILASNATDLTGYPGAMYYNTASSTFRCYQSSTWMNCIGGGAVYQ